MKKTALCTAILAIYALSTPVFADELSDLKAEITAQKQAAAAQQARLDALEQKLNNVQAAQMQAQARAPASSDGKAIDVAFKRGEGLSVSTAEGVVSIYGLIDVSYVRTNHADGKSNNVTSPRVSWFSGNRWGITGAHTMGDSGLNVIFRLESEFENQTGNMDTPGTLFNRDAWAGVESKDFGKLTLGRQNAIARDPAASAIYGDPYGPATPSTEEGGYTNNNNFKQLIFYAGSATGTRVNNGVTWKKAFNNGLLAGVQYQFGGIPGDFANGSTKTLSLAYAGGPFNAAGFATTANVAGLINRTYSLGGNFQAGIVRLNGGYFHYTAEQGALGGRRDNAYTLSAKLAPPGPLDYELGYQNMKATNAAINSGGNVINAFANATAAKATATGSRSTVYGSIFYHFDKITEIYLAADYLRLKDGYKFSATNGAANQTELAIGLRTRF